MRASVASEDNDQPTNSRLDSHGRRLFYEMLQNDRKPIAMVGSGVSVVYGGVSWEKSVELVLDYAKQRLNACTKKFAGDSAEKIRLESLIATVEAYAGEGAIKESSDKYVALDICSEALDHVDRLTDRYDDIEKCQITDDRDSQTTSSFRAYMAKLYKDDTLFMRITLGDRFCIEKSFDKKSAWFKLYDLTDADVQCLASYIYSMTFIKKLTRLVPALEPHAKNITAGLTLFKNEGKITQTDVLPIDRRSLLCLFLAEFDQSARRKLFENSLKHLNKNKTILLTNPAPPRPLLDPLRAMQNWLGVQRYITLNFDYELEHNLILDDERAIDPRPHGFEAACKSGLMEEEGKTGGYTRRFRDGLAASTDIYSEKAVSRLFEFALDSPDYRAQILHLHGRADQPNTMILTDSDSNRQYRRNRISSQALEQALDVVLTGNPILFVGIGLSEAEITRSMRNLVSRGVSTANDPAFAIMVTSEAGTGAWRQQMARYRQYGIHLIAAGHPRSGEQYDFVQHRDVINELIKRIKMLSRIDKNKRFSKKANTALMDRAKKLEMFSDTEPRKLLRLDHIVFIALAAEICAQFTVKMEIDKANSWIDYLKKLDSRLYTMVVTDCLRQLRDGAFAHIKSQNLPLRYANVAGVFKPKPALITGQFDPPNCTRVRDQTIWEKPSPDHGKRHGSKSANQLPPELSDVVQTLLASNSPIITCVAPLGASKGAMLRQFHSLASGVPSYKTYVINCNFGIELDSVIMQVLRFVWHNANVDPNIPEMPIKDRILHIRKAIERGAIPSGKMPTLIFTGIERLVDSDGQSVAPEFDVLLAALLPIGFIASGFQCIFIAADGCSKFLDKLLPNFRRVRQNIEWPITIDPRKTGFLGHLLNTSRLMCHDRSNPPQTIQARATLLKALEIAGQQSTRALAPNSARSPAIVAVLRVVLERWHELAFSVSAMGVIGRARAELDKAILNIFAFVGMPIEMAMVFHIDEPVALAAKIKKLGGGDAEYEFKEGINRLVNFGLLIEIEEFSGKIKPRYALHRSALAEIRHRFGVRSNEELLSNSFSLTLSISMPTDLVVADWDIHRQLKTVVGRLRGAWKDCQLEKSLETALIAVENAIIDRTRSRFDASNSFAIESMDRLRRALAMQQSPMEETLRAAAGIIRSFFSAASLVAQMPKEIVRFDGQLGEFEEHKRRIGFLLYRVREIQHAAKLGHRILIDLKDRFPNVRAEVLTVYNTSKMLSKTIPTPLYGGEIIWLMNERAVIALLQGDLREADRYFTEAMAANALFRSDKPGQSWRRLEINRSLVLIESGRILEANNSLTAIKIKMNDLDMHSKAEDRRTKPLIWGYLALCEHLQGNYDVAKLLYTKTIERLIHSGQHRALAVNYIRRAEMHFGFGDKESGTKDVEKGLAEAQAGRQQDIVWRARLISTSSFTYPADMQKAETIYREARQFADVMQIPRITVQALRSEAEFRLRQGDLEGAGLLATEAMIVANRFGMTLHCVALRVLRGHILLRRGDISGRYLLERAIDLADRMGYQIQVDRAQQALLEASRLRLELR